MPQNSAPFPLLSLVTMCLVLFVFGLVFNQFVAWANKRRLMPVSMQVVIGVGMTLAVPTAFFLQVEAPFWKAALTYVLAFASSGIPMVYGNVRRHTSKDHKKVRRLGNHAAKVRDEVVMDLKATIVKIVAKEAEVVDVVHTLHQVIGSLKSL